MDVGSKVHMMIQAIQMSHSQTVCDWLDSEYSPKARSSLSKKEKTHHLNLPSSPPYVVAEEQSLSLQPFIPLTSSFTFPSSSTTIHLYNDRRQFCCRCRCLDRPAFRV